MVWILTGLANLLIGAFVGLCGVAGFLLPMFYTSVLKLDVAESLALSFAAFIVSGILGSVNYQKAGYSIWNPSEHGKYRRSNSGGHIKFDHTGGTGKGFALSGGIAVRNFYFSTERSERRKEKRISDPSESAGNFCFGISDRNDLLSFRGGRAGPCDAPSGCVWNFCTDGSRSGAF